MPSDPALVYGIPLPPDALALLAAQGLLPAAPPPPPPPPLPIAPPPAAPPALPKLTAPQTRIWRALTLRPLNVRQTELLAIYWRAWRAGEPALAVEEAARRLAGRIDVGERAVDFVKGALRSFGRRLYSTLDKAPVRVGTNRHGEGVADEVPLLALVDILTGPSGEARHRLTDDGAAAVAAALGLGAAGAPSGGLAAPDDDPEEAVLVGMERNSAALLFRVQQAWKCDLDETVRRLAAMAGAG
ncbi:hypothetical protein [Methylosinus sp. Ce-a6]|uniref:hypothetical protein n=1 Tax=Methylosinus sp. Ce-a6 TaxID=2172005 RepID=UPI00191559E7|nr:hypothetical protein [Methylosinus sp. Ce-a6]